MSALFKIRMNCVTQRRQLSAYNKFGNTIIFDKYIDYYGK